MTRYCKDNREKWQRRRDKRSWLPSIDQRNNLKRKEVVLMNSDIFAIFGYGPVLVSDSADYNTGIRGDLRRMNKSKCTFVIEGDGFRQWKYAWAIL